MKFKRALIAAAVTAIGLAGSAMAQEKTLRLLTWADYAPAAVVAQFEQETGYKVELTLSNNEEMISKLRATGGAGFDLAQPSQDRITGPQAEFGIYKPMDLSKLKDPASRKSPHRRGVDAPAVANLERRSPVALGHDRARLLPHLYLARPVVAEPHPPPPRLGLQCVPPLALRWPNGDPPPASATCRRPIVRRPAGERRSLEWGVVAPTSPFSGAESRDEPGRVHRTATAARHRTSL